MLAAQRGAHPGLLQLETRRTKGGREDSRFPPRLQRLSADGKTVPDCQTLVDPPADRRQVFVKIIPKDEEGGASDSKLPLGGFGEPTVTGSVSEGDAGNGTGGERDVLRLVFRGDLARRGRNHFSELVEVHRANCSQMTTQHQLPHIPIN